MQAAVPETVALARIETHLLTLHSPFIVIKFSRTGNQCKACVTGYVHSR